jgi:hypothetical protein
MDLYSVCNKYLCYQFEICHNDGPKCHSEEEAKAMVKQIIEEEGAI